VRYRGFAPFALGAAAAMIVAGLWGAHRAGLAPIDALERLELESLDLRFRLRGPEPAAPEIVLLAFDDATLEAAPHLFERRAGQAEVIRAASATGLQVLGLDLLFADPERLLDPGLSADIDAWLAANPPVEPAGALLARVQAEAHGDDALEAALRAAPPVVLAFHIGARGEDPEAAKLGRGRYGQVVPGPALPVPGDRVLASLPRFNQTADRLGAMTTFTDVSGAVREVPLALGLGSSVYAPLSLQLFAAHRGVSRGEVAFLGSEGAAQVGDHKVGGPTLGLRWRGSPYTTVSVADLVAGRAPRLDGKVGLLGFDHLAQDAVRSPFGMRPGYEVHATALDNLLRGDPLRRAPGRWDFGLSLLAGLLGLAGFLSPRPAVRLGGAGLSVVGALAVLQAAFQAGWWVGAVGPLGALGVGVGVATVAAWLQEGRQRRFLRQSFARYLSPELVEELVAHPERLALRGERRELSVLFTDIRGFTSFSERLGAEELAAFLNAYFSPMTQAVLDHRGYVDKFIGDAVMALFGAPVPAQDHARRACEAVLAMHAALEALQPVAARYGVELAIGAGVNTGEVVVGNLGSSDRFEYTVLGDAVNLASRIEGLTKRYGVFCLVGERTAQQAGPGFLFRAVDLVRVKGKAEPVELFELCAGPGREVARYAETEAYQAGLRAWRAGDFAKAKEAFLAFATKNPHDAVAPLYLNRIEALGVAPEGWDGVFTHTEK
jgi:adenylate cyclase